MRLLFLLALPLAAQPVTVSMQNLTHAGQDALYQVGDQWSITVTGAPSQAVSISAFHDSISIGPAAAVQLDGAGSLVITGKMAQSHVGDWLEMFNGVPLRFTVAAPAPLTVQWWKVDDTTPNLFACASGNAPLLVFRAIVQAVGEDYSLSGNAVVFNRPSSPTDVVELVCP